MGMCQTDLAYHRSQARTLLCWPARVHLGPGPFGPGPIWARPIWARAHLGPAHLGPGPLGLAHLGPGLLVTDSVLGVWPGGSGF